MAVRPRVVVIGAGFGGLAVAKKLAGQPVEVTLVDRENYTTFQPLLYQVATSGLSPTDVAYPVRGLFHKQRNLRFRLGTVVAADWDARELQLSDGSTLAFDHLVVAAGAVTSWFDVPGASEHAFPLYTLDDSVRLRNHIVERFEVADADTDEIDQGALTFVVVGGGPTGVETAGALTELVGVVFHRDYPLLDIGRAHIILLEARDSLLGPFSDPSRQRALESLRSRHVDVRLGTAVQEVQANQVKLNNGETLSAQTVVWAAGVAANPLAEALGLERTRGGRIVVDKDLAVPEHPGVWAVGDVAAAIGRNGQPEPQLAPVAMQAGAHVAKQIGRQTAGKPTRPFHFRDKGTMATIGRRTAVAELPGRIRLYGTPAWLSWLGLHIFYLAGLRNRASVMMNWAWNYLTWDRGARIILRPWARKS
jgi:NADH dehydrogenase